MVGGRTTRLTQRQLRTLQRAVHLVAGGLVLIVVYAGSSVDSAVVDATRWVAAPLLVGSGVLLWKWPRIRTALRGRGR